MDAGHGIAPDDPVSSLRQGVWRVCRYEPAAASDGVVDGVVDGVARRSARRDTTGAGVDGCVLQVRVLQLIDGFNATQNIMNRGLSAYH